MFGGTSNFGSTAPTFGSSGGFTTANTSTNLFGAPQQNASTSIFGSSGGFAAPKTAGFGTATTFGSPQQQPSSLFGAQNRLGGNTTMFSNPTNVASPFSNATIAGNQAQGTSIPFNAITGSDTMMKNGVTAPINTRHQCITCMKEYEQKSLEELRYEDYQLGRKGSAQQASTLFGSGQAQPTGLFSSITSAASTSNAFGAQRTPAFGTVAPQQTSGGLFGNQTKGFFGSAPTSTGFGQTSTPSGGGFSFPATNTQPSIFGQTNPATSTGGLGTTTGFGGFTQPAQQQPLGLFGQKPLTTPAATSTAFGFGSQANPAISKPSTIFPSTTPAFPLTQQTPFGAPNSTAGNPFSAQQKPFSFAPATSVSGFGTPASSAPFSFSSNLSSTAPTFGTAPFGTQTTTTGGFPTFGSSNLTLPTSTSSFTGFNLGGNTGLGASSTGFSFTGGSTFQPGFQQQQGQAMAPSTGPVPFATTPYKDSPLFYNLITNRNLDNMTKPTNPVAQRAVKEASRRRSSTALGSIGPSTSLKQLTFPLSKTPTSNKVNTLFDGFEEEDHGAVVDILSPKTSVKKLSIKTVRGVHRLSLPGNSNTSFNESFANGSVSLDEAYDASANANQKDLRSNPVAVGNGKGDEEVSATISQNGSMYDNPSSFEPREEEPAEDFGIEGIRRLPSEEPEESHMPQRLQSPDPRSVKRTQVYEFDSENYIPLTPDQWEEVTKGRKLNKSGVICTVRGYYTEPAVPELDLYTDDDGSCWIRGFCIGRFNYGRVKFLEAVNVAGLNVDEIVKFRHKEIVVYPEGTATPPVGEGINVRAQVRLERIWPNNKLTREVVTSPTKIRAMKYEELLRKSCERMDATFVSYDDHNGVWTFLVKHFSKYTCVPEEAADEDIECSPPKIQNTGLGGMSASTLKKRVMSPAKEIARSYLYEADCNEKQFPPVIISNLNSEIQVNNLQKQQLEDETGYAGSFDDSVSMMHRRSVLGNIFFPSDIEHLKDSTFYREKLEDSLKETTGFILDTDQARTTLMTVEELSLMGRSSRTLTSDEMYNEIEMDEDARGLFRLSEPIFPLTSSQLRVWQYKEKEAVLKRAVPNPLNLFMRLRMDAASLAVPPRHTRVCFASGGHFLKILNNATPSQLIGFNGEVELKKLHSEFTQIDNFATGEYKGILRTQLEAYLNHSNLDNDVFSLASSPDLIRDHPTIIQNLLGKSVSVHSHHYTRLKQEIQVWKLVNLLWPDARLKENRNQPFEMAQRHELGKWLTENGSMLFSELFEPKDTSVRGYLCRGKKLEACRQAVREKSYVLSLCLAQNNPNTQRRIRCQLDSWEKAGAIDFIEPAMLELYSLCAGYPIWGGLNFGAMTTSEWLQHFATFVWYLSPAHLSIEEIVSFFQATLRDAYAEADEDFSAPSVEGSSSTLANLCIHLLKMYSSVGYPVQKILSPKTYSTDPLNYKVSWFLVNAFIILGIRIESELFESTTSSFAQELEMLGMWEWSIFVLKFLPTSEPRRILIKRLLEQNLAVGKKVLPVDEYEKKIYFLQKRIGLSPQEIRDAQFN